MHHPSLPSRFRAADHACTSFAAKHFHPETLSSRDSYVPESPDAIQESISSLFSCSLHASMHHPSLPSRFRAVDHACTSFAAKHFHPETLSSRDSYVPVYKLYISSFFLAFVALLQACSIAVKQIMSFPICLHEPLDNLGTWVHKCYTNQPLGWLVQGLLRLVAIVLVLLVLIQLLPNVYCQLLLRVLSHHSRRNYTEMYMIRTRTHTHTPWHTHIHTHTY